MLSPTRHGRNFAALRASSRPAHYLHRHRRNPPRKPPDPAPPKPVYMRSTIHRISSILRCSTWDSARDQLRAIGIRWDSFTVNQVLKTHPPMEKAWLFFNWAATLPRFKHDQFTYTTMLDIFGEAGRLLSMWHVFGEMEEKGIKIDAATYTSLMHWLSKDGDWEGAVRAWEEMRRRGCRPTVVSYTAFLKVLFDHGRPKEAAGVYREMLEARLKPNCHTYTVLMEYLAGAGKFEAALEIMSRMQEAGIQPDKATCNILIQKCSKARETSTMTHVLHYMKEHSIVLRRPVFLEALEVLKLNGESDRLLREVNPHFSLEDTEDEFLNSKPAIVDATSLIDRGIILNLLARRNLVAVEHIVSQMIDKGKELDSELISSVVLASCANCKPSIALMAFRHCLKMSKELDRSAYTSLLGLFIRINSFQLVLEVVAEMLRYGSSPGTYVASVLIYRLGCAGFSASAAKIFNSLPTSHNVATFTALLAAYFQAGEVNKGLELYLTMRKHGIPVSSGTYEVLIVGLERAGRNHDAENYRKAKRKFEWQEHSRQELSADESLCDYLFDGHGT